MKAVCNVYSVVLAVVFFLFISFPAHAIESGDNVSGTITNTQPEHSYTFLAQGGDSVVLSLGSEIDFEIDLRSPNGVLLASGDRVIQNALPQNGTYSVTVRGRFPTFVGNYTLHFVKAPDVTEHDTIESGSNFIGNIELGDIESFSFEGEAGENVTLSSAFTGDRFDVVIGLYGPDGRFLNESGSFGDSFINYRLPETGKYSVVIMGRFTTFFGEYDFHFVKSSGASEYGTLVGGLEYEHTITKADIDSFKFSGSEGDAIEISSTGDVSRTTYIYAPDGSRVLARDNSNPLRIASLPQTGTYTVTVVGRFTTFTGDYLLSFHASNQLMKITQAVFHKGDGPIKLVHKRTTAIILDKSAPNYDDTLDLKPQITLSGEDESIFPKDNLDFKKEETKTYKIFYCNGKNNYCNLEKDGLYEVSMTDGTSDFAVQAAIIKDTRLLGLEFLYLLTDGCQNFDSLGRYCGTREAAIFETISGVESFLPKVYPIKDEGLIITNDLSERLTTVDATKNEDRDQGTVIDQFVTYISGQFSDELLEKRLRQDVNLIQKKTMGKKSYPVVFVPATYLGDLGFSDFQCGVEIGGVSFINIDAESISLNPIKNAPQVVSHELGHAIGMFKEYEAYEIVDPGFPANGFDIYSEVDSAFVSNALGYMSKCDAGNNPQNKFWVANEEWAWSTDLLGEDVDDPDILMVGGNISHSDSINLYPLGTGTGFPSIKQSGDYTLTLLDKKENILSTHSIYVDFSLEVQPFGRLFSQSSGYFNIEVEYPLNTYKVSISSNAQELISFDPATKAIGDIILELPSECISDQALFTKDQIFEKAESLVESGRFNSVSTTLSAISDSLNSKSLINSCDFRGTPYDDITMYKVKATERINRLLLRENIKLAKVGDLDNDGDVDRRDLKILKASRKQPVEGDDDPRDLNKDGKINKKDIKLLKSLCTRPKCAKK